MDLPPCAFPYREPRSTVVECARYGLDTELVLDNLGERVIRGVLPRWSIAVEASKQVSSSVVETPQDRTVARLERKVKRSGSVGEGRGRVKWFKLEQ